MFELLIQRLAAHPHPSVRFLALTELRDRDPDRVRVQAVRDAVPDVPPARTILDAQYPAGYWMHPDLGVSPRYRATVWQVLFLAQLGVGAINPVVRAVEYLLEASCDAGGAFHLSKGDEGRSPALTAALLWAVARMGVAEDPRLMRSWSWLHKVCCESRALDALSPAALVWTLRAAAAWEREDWAARLIPELSFEPLQALTFPLTHQPDALARIEAWCDAHPLANYDTVPTEVESLRDALLAKLQQEPVKGWALERVPGKLWFNPGSVGAYNPWVTIRALRVLRCLDRVRV